MDTLTKRKRSWNMSLIRSKNTSPEKIVRSTLHKMGYRFRLHPKDLPGKPDIIIPKYKILIFVNGCFWHQHKGCKRAFIPKSNRTFWVKKFKKNTERDKLNKLEMLKSRWKVITIWECQTIQKDKLFDDLGEKLIENSF